MKEYVIPKFRYGHIKKGYELGIAKLSWNKHQWLMTRCFADNDKRLIRLEYFYIHDYMLMYNTMVMQTALDDMINTIKIHREYNPFVDYSLRLKYDRLSRVFYGIWRFHNPYGIMIHPDYFNVHFFDIIKKYDEGVYNFRELYMAIATYIEFYSAMMNQKTFNLMFSTRRFTRIWHEDADYFFPDLELKKLPARNMLMSNAEFPADGNVYGIKTDKKYHAYFILGELGNSMGFFDANEMTYDDPKLIEDPRISFILSGMGLTNIIFEGFYSVYKRSDNKPVFLDPKQMINQSGNMPQGKNNYDFNYSQFEIFDAYSMDECRSGVYKYPIEERNRRVIQFFDGMKTNRLKTTKLFKVNINRENDANYLVWDGGFVDVSKEKYSKIPRNAISKRKRKD